MEDNLKQNGRRPKQKWKMTSKKNGREPQKNEKMEDDHKYN